MDPVHAVARRLSFPRNRRLRKRREYLHVQGRGRRLNGRNFLFFACARAASGDSSMAGEARFGITVTRKIGNAVIRNRVKRIVREVCRHSVDLFPARFDLVIVARASAVTAGFGDVVAELADVARRLGSPHNIPRGRS